MSDRLAICYPSFRLASLVTSIVLAQLRSTL
jgi:hypothetical protein